MQVVVSAPPTGLHASDSTPASLNSKASVAITGGSGGLGLLMAQWLATSGAARHIHLFSRTGRLTNVAAAAPPGLLELEAGSSKRKSSDTHAQPATLQQWLPGSGVSVSLHAADVSFASDLHAAMQGSRGSSTALTCGTYDVVLHAAGVLEDSLIGSQSQNSIRAVMAPKLGSGASHSNIVAAASAGLPLQQLVLFSSIASCVGAAGQANYVASNAVLDGWAAAARQQGLSASSVQWGAWATAGMRKFAKLTLQSCAAASCSRHGFHSPCLGCSPLYHAAQCKHNTTCCILPQTGNMGLT